MRVALYQHFLDVLHKKMYYDQKLMTNIFKKPHHFNNSTDNINRTLVTQLGFP